LEIRFLSSFFKKIGEPLWRQDPGVELKAKAVLNGGRGEMTVNETARHYFSSAQPSRLRN
jgi:hypothetical protein